MSRNLHKVTVNTNYQILSYDDIVNVRADVITLDLPLIDDFNIKEGWECWVEFNSFVSTTIQTADSTFLETGGGAVTFNTNVQAQKFVKLIYMNLGWNIEWDFANQTKFLALSVADFNADLTVQLYRPMITIPLQMAGWFIKKVTYATASAGGAVGSTKIGLSKNVIVQATTQITLTPGIRFLTAFPHLQVLEGDFIQLDINTVSSPAPKGLAAAIELSPY